DQAEALYGSWRPRLSARDRVEDDGANHHSADYERDCRRRFGTHHSSKFEVLRGICRCILDTGKYDRLTSKQFSRQPWRRLNRVPRLRYRYDSRSRPLMGRVQKSVGWVELSDRRPVNVERENNALQPALDLERNLTSGHTHESAGDFGQNVFEI